MCVCVGGGGGSISHSSVQVYNRATGSQRTSKEQAQLLCAVGTVPPEHAIL